MGIRVFPILSTPSHLPPHPIPLGHPSAPALSTLSHASNLDWRSCFTYDNIHVSMLFSQIILLSPSPTESKICSLHLCLFCYLAYRVIVTIFLIRRNYKILHTVIPAMSDSFFSSYFPVFDFSVELCFLLVIYVCEGDSVAQNV